MLWMFIKSLARVDSGMVSVGLKAGVGDRHVEIVRQGGDPVRGGAGSVGGFLDGVVVLVLGEAESAMGSSSRGAWVRLTGPPRSISQ